MIPSRLLAFKWKIKKVPKVIWLWQSIPTIYLKLPAVAGGAREYILLPASLAAVRFRCAAGQPNSPYVYKHCKPICILALVVPNLWYFYLKLAFARDPLHQFSCLLALLRQRYCEVHIRFLILKYRCGNLLGKKIWGKSKTQKCDERTDRHFFALIKQWKRLQQYLSENYSCAG